MPESGTPPAKTAFLQWLHYLQGIGVDEVTTRQTYDRLIHPFQTPYGKEQEATPANNPEVSVKTAKSEVLSIQAKLKAITTLDALREALENFSECPLKLTATHTVFGDGNPNSKIMLVGEAPGADEDRLGRPFVGMSGQLLEKMFDAIGLPRKDLYISNIIPWRPPGNRPPTATETALCMPFIQRHIEIVNPEILIMVGGVSAKTLLGRNDGIMRLRGQWIDFKTDNMDVPIKAIPIYHPAYLLRSPGQKRKSWHDLLTIKKYLTDHPS